MSRLPFSSTELIDRLEFMQLNGDGLNKIHIKTIRRSRNYSSTQQVV